MRRYMMIQVFTGFPFLQQAETVFVFDIAKNAITYATCLLCRRFDHGEKGLHHFQLLFRDDVQGDSKNDHCGHLPEMPTFSICPRFRARFVSFP